MKMKVPRKFLSLGIFPGGGISGYISARLAQEFANQTRSGFHDSFDQIHAVSVGTINAAALWPLIDTGQPPVIIDDLVNAYKTRRDSILQVNRPQNGPGGGTSGHKEILEILKPKLKGITLADYRAGLHLYVLDHWQQTVKGLSSKIARGRRTENFPIIDLLEAATSIPKKPIEDILRSQHFFANANIVVEDPSLYALTENLNDEIHVTNFGTGTQKTSPAHPSNITKIMGNLNTVFALQSTFAHQAIQDLMIEKLGNTYVDVNITNTEPEFTSQIHGRIEEFITSNQELFRKAVFNATGEYPANIIRFAEQPKRARRHALLSVEPEEDTSVLSFRVS